MTRRTAIAAIVTCAGVCAGGVCAGSAPLLAHPHDGDKDTLLLKGTITAINLKDGTLALDGVDPATKRPRNFFLFLDRKIKVTRAKKKIPLSALTPGQPIICTVEIDAMPDADSKMIAFQIQVDLKAFPAARPL
jgi:hypothetical protein